MNYSDEVARLSIHEVISRDVTLRRIANNYIGLCPFHREKTPSFTVNEEKGIFHCFGCGVGGNTEAYLKMKYKKKHEHPSRQT